MKNRLIGAALAVAAVLFAATLYRRWASEFAWDFAINWMGGYALRVGLPLYDGAALRPVATGLVSPLMRHEYGQIYTSYVGPPTTALLLLPLSYLPFSGALFLYRVLSLVAFGAAVWVAGLALPPQDRRAGWTWGALALLLLNPVQVSLSAGQLDAWVALSLAVSTWAYARGRWWLAGSGAALAALLKVSPGLLILLFLAQRRYRAAAAALLAAAALVGLATWVGGPSNLRSFLFEVAPALARGTLHIENQSLPAWVARLSAPDTDLNQLTAGLGALRWLGPALALAGTAWLARAPRAVALPQPAIGLLVLVALLAGPLTWDHYASWSIVSLAGLADRRLWQEQPAGRRRWLAGLLLAGGLLVAWPISYFSPAQIEAHWWLRLATGSIAAGLMLWLGAGARLLLGAAPVPAAIPTPAPGTAQGA